MNYTELSVEERMQHAEEYALILADEIKTQEQVLNELAQTFSLSHEKALEALVNSKKKFSIYHKASTKKKNLFMLVLLLVSTIAAPFYFFISDNNGLGVLGIFGILFVLSAVSTVIYFVNNTIEALILKYPWLGPFKKGKLIFFSNLAFAFFIIAIFSYFFRDVFSSANTVYKTFRLHENVTKERSSGKGTTYHYKFLFEGYEKEFHFSSADHSYGNDIYRLLELRKGDSVTVCLLRSSLPKLEHEGWLSKNNRIVNISFNGKELVDFNYRNGKLKAERQMYLTIAIVIFTVLITILFVKLSAAKRRYEEQSGK